MAQDFLRYQPNEGGREGWLAQIAKFVAIANEDPALGVTQGAGAPDLAARPHAPGVGNGNGKEGGFSGGIIAAQRSKPSNCPMRSGRRMHLPRAPLRKS
jgi:hypothetical protein